MEGNQRKKYWSFGVFEIDILIETFNVNKDIKSMLIKGGGNQ